MEGLDGLSAKYIHTVLKKGLDSFFHKLKYILIINTLHKTKDLKKIFFVPFLSRYKVA